MSNLILERTRVSVFVSAASEIDAALTAATAHVREAAPDDRSRGVLITAHGPGAYVVTLSHEVPYGLSRERYAY